MIKLRVTRSEESAKTFILTLTAVQDAADPRVRSMSGSISMEVDKSLLGGTRMALEDELELNVTKRASAAERANAERVTREAKDHAESERLAQANAEAQKAYEAAAPERDAAARAALLAAKVEELRAAKANESLMAEAEAILAAETKKAAKAAHPHQ